MRYSIVFVIFAAFLLSSASAKSGECDCTGDTCECCEHVEFKEGSFNVNDTFCAQIQYLPAVYGVSFILKANKLILINETFSLENPDVCFGIGLGKGIEGCLDFTNLHFTRKDLSGCLAVGLSVLDYQLFTINFGCFDIHVPLKSPHLPPNKLNQIVLNN
eukprot:TRINITY_DN1843_c0_g1_i1.p1 TRINITY_DN1843_c0_g1~~TRINITY_DN1843_c0_g1_i1.p1  ORF type:complete len:160 (+),score=40.25 TRINITY_DN1843_c0_g1_i1:45-524(+)